MLSDYLCHLVNWNCVCHFGLNATLFLLINKFRTYRREVELGNTSRQLLSRCESTNEVKLNPIRDISLLVFQLDCGMFDISA